MKLVQIPFILLCIIVTSCYFFPFQLAAFPVGNSKMFLALLGLVFLGVQLVNKSNAFFDEDFLKLTLWAMGISLMSFLSTLINETTDYTFTTYVMSMWVWLGGAYAMVSFIKITHQHLSIKLISNYLIIVCVVQCCLALLFDNNTEANDWHNTTFSGSEGYMGMTGDSRLHGIGCALDVAGFRFAAVLCMAMFFFYYSYKHGNNRDSLLYIASFFFLTVIGNMLSRSTIIGTGLGLIFILLISVSNKGNIALLNRIICISVVGILFTIYYYNTDDSFHNNIRFGFEGFFNLFETGEWKTGSNDILKDMIVWPDNIKTWLIGDGYLKNPANPKTEFFNPYYIGPSFHGFYMNTDIGYIRYIFYFGLIGLFVVLGFFFNIFYICIRRFPNFVWFFAMIFAVNLIEWTKVMTDLFVVFAPFLCLTRQEEDYSECLSQQY